jgi:succinate---hydroxymethylglutarate CoA-transferase
MTFGASPNKPTFNLGNSNTMPGAGSATNTNGAGAGTNTSSITDSTSYRAPFSVQFSAATEMILKRLRGEGGPLNPSSALGLGAGGAVQPPGYEDVRRSVLQGMKTTLNMDMPVTTPTVPKKGARASTARISTSTISTPTASAPIIVNASAGTMGGTGGGSGSANRGKIPAKSGKARAGNKRKRAKDESESEVSDVMSGLGEDSDSDGAGSVTHLPTQTLSGRKVVKPTQFSPAAVEGPSRKRGGYKRTGRNVDQALCKRCGRGHSPASNMIVFCDGCNLGWHQMCHDPMVSDELVRDESKEWFCNDCSAKREKAAKPTLQVVRDSGWAGKSVEEV